MRAFKFRKEFVDWIEAGCFVGLCFLSCYVVITGFSGCSLVFCRVLSGGHSLTWLVVFGVGLGVGSYYRKFSVGLLFALLLAFSLEDAFGAFFIVNGGSVTVLTPLWWIALFALVLSKPFWRYFDFERFLLLFPVLLAYLVCWSVIGFPVTVGGNGPTQFFLNPYVSMIEVGCYVLWGVVVCLCVRPVRFTTTLWECLKSQFPSSWKELLSF